jgi:putative ABC transport system permease protein
MKYLFKTIIRNFRLKPATNLINLVGLAISLTLVIILSVYCYSELTTDSHQVNGKRVYLYGLSEDHIYTPGVLKDQIDMNIPGVESVVRMGGSWEAPVFQVENKEPMTSDLIFADESFFKLFTYEVIEGNLESALKEPMKVVITKSLSDKLFGGETALGKPLKLNNTQVLTVSAVIEEPKANSCISFSAITSMATRKVIQPEEGEFTQWNECNFQTFILLKKGNNPLEITKTILSLFPEKDRDRFKSEELVPLKQIYFSKFSLFGSNYLVNGEKKKVMILLLVATLVLMIALINFVNISSSQWQERIKQTGVMKVIGALRSTIIRDILVESFLFFFAALLIAFYFVYTLNPIIQNYIGIHYSQQIFHSPGFIMLSLAIIIGLSVIFSIIPALHISYSRAIDNLKKTVKPVKTNFSFRGFLIIMQFTIAIVLIVFTMLVQKQVRFGSSNLGFNQGNIIGIKLTEQLTQKKEVLKDLLQKEPAINQISFSQYYPGETISQWGSELDMNGEKKDLNFDTFSADADFFKILGLKTVSGRFYSNDLSTDNRKAVVNETFLREHNIINPIGGKITSGERGYEIIGVVKDFHYKPLNQPVVSLVIRSDSSPTWRLYCLINIKTENFKSLTSTIEKLKKTVSELSPSFPVEVSFFDQAIQNMYQSELNFRRAFSLLAGCAIVLCCMGILAMSLFACQRRVKEIGIRKVNGAKISEILAMLNKEFVKWVAISFVISTPIAWYFMHKWLKSFAYKTDLSWWIFALGGLMALGIALLTVSWQSWSAATRNPVEALRYE